MDSMKDMERKTLERERERLARTLPPVATVLRASLFERTVRCGKPNCRCAAPDDPGHRVVCLSRSLPEGKNAQVTLPQRLAPVAEAWVHDYRRWLEAVERISEINHELLRRRWVDPPEDEGSRGH